MAAGTLAGLGLAASATPLGLVAGLGAAGISLVGTKASREEKKARHRLARQVQFGRGLSAEEEQNIKQKQESEIEARTERDLAELFRGGVRGGSSGLSAKGRLGIMGQAGRNRMQAFSERAKMNIQALAEKRKLLSEMRGQAHADTMARRQQALSYSTRIPGDVTREAGEKLSTRIGGFIGRSADEFSPQL